MLAVPVRCGGHGDSGVAIPRPAMTTPIHRIRETRAVHLSERGDRSPCSEIRADA